MHGKSLISFKMSSWNLSSQKDSIQIPHLLFVMILTGSLGSELNTKSSVLVELDPYVSILDCENGSRYGIREMVPFVSLVSTQFTQVFIRLSENDLLNGLNSSLSLSPQAVAQYNAFNKPKIPIKVWLGYRGSFNTITNNRKLSKILFQLESYAHLANNIYETTVTTVLLSQTFFINANKNTKIPSTFGNKFKIGVLLDPNITSCTSDHKTVLTNTFNFKLKPTLVMFSPNRIADKLNQDEIQSFFSNFLRDCQNFNLTSSNTGFLLGIPDTNELAQVNMHRLVSTHKLIENLAKERDFPIILSKAFDTPCQNTIESKTSGLWRLIENFQYKNTTTYRFEDKTAIAASFDNDENFLNETWLKSNITIYRNSTGIIFSLFDQKRSRITPYPEPDLKPILEYMENQFSKVIIMLEDNTRHWILVFLFALKQMREFSDKVEMTLMVLPNNDRIDFQLLPIEEIGRLASLPHEKLSSFVIPFVGKKTAKLSNDAKTIVLKNRNLTVTKFGYLFPMSICSLDPSSLKNYEEGSLFQTINDVDSSLIYFHFEENEETVKLGATRMFSQRIVLFEQCRTFLRNCGSPTKKLRLGFVLLHYATNLHFYKNSLSIQNFVKYWELLSSWAESRNTTVILNNVVDGSRTFKETGQILPEVGWWRYSKDSGSTGGEIIDDKMWLNKQEETLYVAKKEEEEKAKLNEELINSARGLGTTSIILIVVVPLGVCALFISLSRYLIRRYYRETYLSRREIDEFFLGNDDLIENEENNNKPNKMPYDKQRYEVDGDKFEIQEGPALGCGEFGKVCLGKLETELGIITVAVKTVNPEKIRKTTLNGLLSEIKVLAHLGKHENVTELIGANTVDLKHGKVFIFLELCQLGSLEKYLRKLRPEFDAEKEQEFYSAYQTSSGSEVHANDKRYVNMISIGEEVTIDEELSRDLYRWSKEICSGMAYLASKHVVHADLATRNVLLNLRKEAKLCDFGLSRKLYNYTNYVKKQQEPLPWKWMSPEALRLLAFNEKSDVWAYGVTLWEIYSLGDSPYPGLSFNLNFGQMLENGFRLGKPKFNDRDMYTTMKKCWFTNPAKRPTFSDLLTEFR